MKIGQLYNRANIVAITELIAANFAAAQNATTAPTSARTTAKQAKAARVARIINNSDFGCQRDNVRKLVQELIGCTLPEPATDHDGSVITIKPLIGGLLKGVEGVRLVVSFDSDGDVRCVDAEGEEDSPTGGTYVGVSEFDQLTLPTDAEVEAFLVELGL